MVRLFAYAAAALAAIALSSKPAESGVVRVSVGTGGYQADFWSLAGPISADGSHVVFDSTATNLDALDTDDGLDLYEHDMPGNRTWLSSVSSTGARVNGVTINWGGISADGRCATFLVNAANVVPGASGLQLYMRDCTACTTTLISASTAGAVGNGESGASCMTPSGRYVAFVSASSNLVDSDTNGSKDVFVRDIQQNQTWRESTQNITKAEAHGDFGGVALNADASVVAFDSTAADLISGDTNGKRDVFVSYTSLDGTQYRHHIERVSVGASNAQGDGDSWGPAISADGRYVAFISKATNLWSGASTSGAPNVFRRDRQTGITWLVSGNTLGFPSNSNAINQVGISADGRYVTWDSDDDGITSGDSNGKSDVFVTDMQTHTTVKVSKPATGQSNGDSIDPYINGDGRYVAFTSLASNLVSDDTQPYQDVFVAGPLFTPVVSMLAWVTQPGGGVAGSPLSTQPVVEVRDANGYLLWDVTGSVTLSITPGTGTSGAVLGGTTTVPLVNGRATFGNLSIDKAGTGYALTATFGGVTATSSSIAVSSASYTLADVVKVLRIAGGLDAGPGDPEYSRLNLVASVPGRLDVLDAVSIYRRALQVAGVVTRTSSNAFFDYGVLIDDAGLNGNPNAAVLACHEYVAAANAKVGVVYYAGKWLVFNEDRSPMANGERFHYYAGSDSKTLTRGAESATMGWGVRLDNPDYDGNASANPLATHLVTNVNDVSPLGMWWDGGHWWAYNENTGVALTNLERYDVVSSAGHGGYIVRSSANDYAGIGAYLDDARINSKPGAVVLAQHTWLGNYINSPICVKYDSSAGKWAARREDGNPIPMGEAVAYVIGNP